MTNWISFFNKETYSKLIHLLKKFAISTLNNHFFILNKICIEQECGLTIKTFSNFMFINLEIVLELISLIQIGIFTVLTSTGIILNNDEVL